MGLFGFGKKEKKTCPLCGNDAPGLFSGVVLKDGAAICDKCADKLRTHYSNGVYVKTDALGFVQYKENGYAKTGIYDELNGITLAEAKAVFEEERAASNRILDELGSIYGSVYRVSGDSYNISPKALDVGLARAKKMKNRSVVEGILVKGDFNRDEDAVIIINGSPRTAKVIEAHRKEVSDLETTLSANGKKGLMEGQPGWLILDTEERIPDGAIIAKK